MDSCSYSKLQIHLNGRNNILHDEPNLWFDKRKPGGKHHPIAIVLRLANAVLVVVLQCWQMLLSPVVNFYGQYHVWIFCTDQLEPTVVLRVVLLNIGDE